MNYLFSLNNNLIRLIGQYNMISKESVLNNKVIILIDINFISYVNTQYTIKERNQYMNFSRKVYKSIFKISEKFLKNKINKIIKN
jgi:hypothetical protein